MCLVIKIVQAGIKLNADLRKRKQELLDKQLNQQKLLIQRMETSNITQQQKSTLMATIKTLQVYIYILIFNRLFILVLCAIE